MRTVMLVALAFLAGSVTTAWSATSSGPRYTLRERTKLQSHHCRTEDSYMFIPARRVMDGVTYDTPDHPLCVQIDNTYRAPRG